MDNGIRELGTLGGGGEVNLYGHFRKQVNKVPIPPPPTPHPPFRVSLGVAMGLRSGQQAQEETAK